MAVFKENLGQHTDFTAILHYRPEVLDGVISGADPTNYIDPWGLLSYLVSRPLSVSSIASHNFIVTNAEYIGDPKATVYSYGKNSNGMTGRVDEKTRGFSQGTSTADKAFWSSLRAKNNPCSDVTQIDASDFIVDSFANSLIENQPYAAVPKNYGTNSNSAAQAVANRSANKYVPTPGDGRLSPGASRWFRTKFSMSVLSASP